MTYTSDSLARGRRQKIRAVVADGDAFSALLLKPSNFPLRSVLDLFQAFSNKSVRWSLSTFLLSSNHPDLAPIGSRPPRTTLHTQRIAKGCWKRTFQGLGGCGHPQGSYVLVLN